MMTVKVQSKNPYFDAEQVNEQFLKNPPDYAYKADSGKIFVDGIPVDIGDWVFIDTDIYDRVSYAVITAESFSEFYEVVEQ